jgi:probable phosphoglycerate mutase
MKIYFIRHGETTGDIEDLYGGAYDDHLSEQGVTQSKALAATLKGKGIETIYASSLIRAQETAAYIAEVTHADIIAENDLRERNQYGELTGMNKGEAKAKFPEQVELLKDRLNTLSGAESYEDFRDRFAATFARIVGGDKSAIAIVTHGGGFRVLFRDVLKWGELKMIGDCACVLLEKDGDTYKWIDASNVTPEFPV